MKQETKNKIVDIVAKNLYNHLASFLTNEIFIKSAGYGQPDGTYAIYPHQKEFLQKIKRSEWGDEFTDVNKSIASQRAKIVAEELIKELEIDGII